MLVAGCTSPETKNDYVDTVNEIQRDVQESFAGATGNVPSSKQELVALLQEGETALTEAVSRLEEVAVPEEAEAGHPDLVAGIDDLRELFAKAAKDVESASGAAAFAAVNDLASEGTRIGREIDAAIDRINQDIGAE